MLRVSLRTIMAVFLVAAIALSVKKHFWPPDIFAPPPKSIVTGIEERFDDLNQSMSMTEAFRTLGLGQYREYLLIFASNSGGIGGMRTHIRFENADSSLEFVRHFDGRNMVLLWSPSAKHPKEAKLLKGELR